MKRTDDGVTIVPQQVKARFDGLLSRIGLRGTFARDCALAVVVSVLTVLVMVPMLRADAVGLGADGRLLLTGAQVDAIIAAGAVQSAVLCLRRIRPVTCLLLVVAAQLVMIASAPPEFSLRVIAPFVIAYTVGTVLTTRRALLVAVAVALIEGAGAVLLTIGAVPFGPVLVLGEVGQAMITYGPVILLGVYVRTRRGYLAMLHERADEAVRSREAAVRSAIGDERRGIARELHDVAAHHLSGMVVQAAAVQRLIDSDPEAAKAANAWIRSQGKETLSDLRSVVGLLRVAPDRDPNTPVPGLASLEDLVATANELGSEVELVRVGPPAQLPPLTDISLYRIAQQALTNARQHAPATPVRLTLTLTDTEVDLQVVNGPGAERAADDTDAGNTLRADEPGGTGRRAGTGPEEIAGETLMTAPAAEEVDATHNVIGSNRERHGVGLVGMRERARLVGARLTAGPDDGGWSVRVIASVSRAEPVGEKGATS